MPVLVFVVFDLVQLAVLLLELPEDVLGLFLVQGLVLAVLGQDLEVLQLGDRRRDAASVARWERCA